MTAAEWIAKRRELLDAATEGPWCYGGQGWVFAEALLRSGDGEPRGMRDLLASVGSSDEDALLIADARTSLPRALDALEAVLALHRREERWGSEDYSIDAAEYAARKTDNDEVNAGWALDSLSAFGVCAECYRVEQSIEQRDGVSVLEGLWPCPTAAAVESALRDES